MSINEFKNPLDDSWKDSPTKYNPTTQQTNYERFFEAADAFILYNLNDNFVQFEDQDQFLS